jgi:hypothetical protein
MMPILSLLNRYWDAVGFTSGSERSEGKLEKRMQGDATRIDGRNTGRRGYHQAFAAVVFSAAQKGRLAGSGLAGQENMAAGVTHKFTGQTQFGVGGIHCHSMP